MFGEHGKLVKSMKQMKEEKYLKIIEERFNGNIEIAEDYVDFVTKVKHHCKKHDEFWLVSPQTLVQCKYGCKVCLKENKNITSGRYKYENFIKELEDTNPHFNDFEVLNQDINAASDRVKCKCKVCSHEWETNAQKILTRKSGCPKCANVVRFTNEHFLEILKEKQIPVEPLEEYQGIDTKILCRCKKCGNEWKISPYKLNTGRRCPICSRKEGKLKITKTHEEFVEEMRIANPTVEIISKYINYNEKVKCRCTECSWIWEATPGNLLKYRGCPVCACSNGERRIHKFLKDNDIKYNPEYTFEDCFNDRKLRFDFYLPDYNMCIEFDGEQHYRPVDFGTHDQVKVEKNFEALKLRDEIKNEYCKEHNISLLRIPYWDFTNIESILEDYFKLKRAV